MTSNSPAESPQSSAEVPVIDLAAAAGAGETWGKPKAVVYLWGLAEVLLVTNPLQVSSRLRVATLRAFGAKIGENVVFRPRTRVRFPWKLEIGDGSWIGEGVWLHNQDQLTVGKNVVLSQDVFVTTGSHAVRTDMRLITKPVHIDAGAWVTTRSVVLGGVTIGRSCVVTPNSVVRANSELMPNTVWTGNPVECIGTRFPEERNA